VKQDRSQLKAVMQQTAVTQLLPAVKRIVKK